MKMRAESLLKKVDINFLTAIPGKNGKTVTRLMLFRRVGANFGGVVCCGLRFLVGV